MIWIGTSGYNYPEWKGSFYPADLPAAKMLPYYAARFPTVEINYTFYRMPNEKLVGGWAGSDAVAVQADAEGAAPDHARQPAEEHAASSSAAFCLVAGDARRQARRAAVSAAAQPEEGSRRCSRRSSPSCRHGSCAAFEFRHPSWFDDDVFERLAARNLALCVADSEKLSTPVRVTADYAYFRLRDEGYTPDDIERWAETIARETSGCTRRVRVLQARGGGERAGVRAGC